MNNPENLHVYVESLPQTGASWVDILSALLVPAIAVFGVFIAYLQYRLNRQRLQHETYDHRMSVFRAIKTHLSEIMRNGTTDFDSALKFYHDASEAVFLFDKSVENFIEEIYKKSIEMAREQELMYPSDGSPGLPVGEERSKVAENHSELLKWHTDKIVELKPFFAKKLGV